jgi:hypothetical protein
MPTPFAGGCACGAIRYECSAKPLLTLQCHCRDCQRASGGGCAVNVIVPAVALTFTTGVPTYYRVTNATGRTRDLAFCPRCGSPLGVKIEAYPDIRSVSAASLDDPSQLELTANLWTSSAQPWEYLNPHLPQYERQPTPEEFQALLATQG